MIALLQVNGCVCGTADGCSCVAPGDSHMFLSLQVGAGCVTLGGSDCM